MQALRAAYFAAGETASGYGITFSGIVEHLWRARRFDRRLRLGDVRHMEDLLQAIACTDGQPQAWSDLAERFERLLIRQCEPRMDSMRATVAVRQLFAALRRRAGEDASASRPCMRWYSGARPLRHWLAERLAVQLAGAVSEGLRYGNVILELRQKGGDAMPVGASASAAQTPSGAALKGPQAGS